MIKRILSIVLLLLILVQSLLVPIISAEPAVDLTQALQAVEPNSSVVLHANSSPTDDVENLFFLQEDLVVQGVTNRQDYFFELSSSRSIQKGSYFQLYLGHSPTLLPLKSTLTIFLDDIPLGTQFLNEKNEQAGTWKINFPDTELKPGFHKISILTHMEATDNLCEDQNNTSNWTLFRKESVIHFNYKKSYETADFSWYPSPFVEKGSVKPLKSLFILPDHPNEAQLGVLSKLSAHFSSLVPASMLEFTVLKEAELSDALIKTTNQIWIGSKESWSGNGKRLVEDLQKKQPALASGLMGLTPSPWNPANSILLLAGSDAELANAAHVITDKSLYSQLTGNAVDLTQLPLSKTIKPVEASKASTTISLSDMGYQDLIIESPLVGAARVNYSIPSEWEVYKDAKLKLQYRHTKTLNFAQSLMTVRVNNVPLQSKYLNEESSDFGSQEIDIPLSLLTTGSIGIDIGFQFNSSTDSCTGNSQIGNWAIVSKDSFLTLAYRPSHTVDFSHLPFPFVVKGAWANTDFLMDSQPSSEALSLLATVSGLIGKNATTQSDISIRKGPPAASIEKGKNYIYIGSVSGIPDLANQSPQIPISASKGVLASMNPNIELLKSSSAQSGLIEIFPLTEESNYMMVIAATDNQMIKRMNTLLNDPVERKKMFGQAILIDPLSRIHSYMLEQKKSAPSILEQSLDVLSPNNKPYMSRIVLIGGVLAIIILVVLVIWIVRRRKK
ncbi:cellulose biosynthesis cyclic di-GMP-binding regulatory protein BcsB [Paenibacillus agricola]|uniref:Cellulose synthase subunit n=1 Tax=Paenibacillus agricola TaxID=2716264 RepID=A0ABX0JFH2_9BACL|nr:cellulose biosynthesis cyclic di-GMP-binding regulatory protein BcsB [Paenibacillus agricola]NHN33448.1 hypothetical protein [Paenibacillus agricola]